MRAQEVLNFCLRAWLLFWVLQKCVNLWLWRKNHSSCATPTFKWVTRRVENGGLSVRARIHARAVTTRGLRVLYSRGSVRLRLLTCAAFAPFTLLEKKKLFLLLHGFRRSAVLLPNEQCSGLWYIYKIQASWEKWRRGICWLISCSAVPKIRPSSWATELCTQIENRYKEITKRHLPPPLTIYTQTRRWNIAHWFLQNASY